MMTLGVGDPRRRVLGRGAHASLALAGLFVIAAIVQKDIRSLATAAPWGEDPYDAFVSFGIFFVAGVAFMTVLRIFRCRRDVALPLSRAIAVERGAIVIVLMVLVICGAAWWAVAQARGSLPPRATLLVDGLALMTAAAAGAAVLVVRAARQLPTRSAPVGPDLLDDLVEVVSSGMGRLGTSQTSQKRGVWAAARLGAAVRRAPLRTAAFLAVCFGAFFSSGALLEGDDPLLALLIGFVGGAAMLAFFAITGRILQVVRRQVGEAPRRPSLLGRSLVGAAIAIPAALTFRDQLWWLVGSTAEQARIPELGLLLAIAAAGGFAVAYVIARLARSA